MALISPPVSDVTPFIFEYHDGREYFDRRKVDAAEAIKVLGWSLNTIVATPRMTTDANEVDVTDRASELIEAEQERKRQESLDEAAQRYALELLSLAENVRNSTAGDALTRKATELCNKIARRE